MTVSSSDGYIHVNYSGVDNVEEALVDATKAVGNVLAELQQIITPLTSSWLGVSEDEYTQVQNRWNQDIDAMNVTLARYASTLDEIKINYGNTDNGLAVQWSEIT